MIQFKPEPLGSLKSRFKEALIDSYCVANVKENPEERPGDKPRHVFDFEDGIRLIVSRDVIKSQEVIHFSGSFEPAIYSGSMNMQHILDLMVYKFIVLWGTKPHVNFVGFTSKGIPHWCIKSLNLN